MTDTRSARLSSGLVTGAGFWLIYSNPVGITSLVKTIHYTNNVGSTFRVEAHLRTAGQTVMVQSTTLAGFGSVAITGWYALAPGDELLLANYADYPVTFWISGTHLEGVSPYPPQGPIFEGLLEASPLPAVRSA